MAGSDRSETIDRNGACNREQADKQADKLDDQN